jgi:integrase
MEALRLGWQDVDFETQRLHIGRDGQTKNREPRAVDFNSDLAVHLRDMHARKASGFSLVVSLAETRRSRRS